jgi:dipeptidase D
MANAFPQGLEPALLWQSFDLIRSLPHGSGNEAQLIEALKGWAAEHGFEAVQDEVGNLLVRVPASPGYEDHPVVVLQGHIDMVCEKNADTEFDFATQGIDVALDGDWLHALGTTLGADNAIGVAGAMAVAIDPDALHPPLELLMTVDEETGMTGAFGLEPGFVTGKTLINCDTEEEGAIYVGCSGGGDVIARFPLEQQKAKKGRVPYRISVKGLKGGHSGLDIHENRANAIKCLARVLWALDRHGVGLRLATLEGGSMRNAVPREATCALFIKPKRVEAMQAVVAELQAELQAEFRATDPDLVVELAEIAADAPKKILERGFQAYLVRTIMAVPSAVIAMSGSVPGLVETSNNLGVVRMTDEAFELVCCARSSLGSALEAVRASLVALFELAGAHVELDDSYPGWLPDMDSPLLAKALAVHQELFGPAEIKAVHAGLECGLLQQAIPGCDMISIGPDITGAHSPTERVSVPSTAKFYQLLVALLAAL